MAQPLTWNTVKNLTMHDIGDMKVVGGELPDLLYIIIQKVKEIENAKSKSN